MVLSNFSFLVFGRTADGLSKRCFTGAPFTAELLLDADDLIDEGFFDRFEARFFLFASAESVQMPSRTGADFFSFFFIDLLGSFICSM